MQPHAEPPLGPLVDPSPARRPARTTLAGRTVALVPLDPAAHGGALWDAVGAPEHDHLWLYLFAEPFAGRAAFDADLVTKAASEDPLFFAILERESSRAAGTRRTCGSSRRTA